MADHVRINKKIYLLLYPFYLCNFFQYLGYKTTLSRFESNGQITIYNKYIFLLYGEKIEHVYIYIFCIFVHCACTHFLPHIIEKLYMYNSGHAELYFWRIQIHRKMIFHSNKCANYSKIPPTKQCPGNCTKTYSE